MAIRMMMMTTKATIALSVALIHEEAEGKENHNIQSH
jgi:hypothetical protein